MARDVVSFLIENTLIFWGLFAGVWLIKLLFRKHLSSRLQYLLWGIVVLKLLIPFSVTADWSPAITIPELAQVQTANAQNGEAAKTAYETGTASGAQTDPDTAADVQADPADASTARNANIFFRMEGNGWANTVIAIWVGGIIVSGLWLWSGMRRIRQTIRRCGIVQLPPWMQELLLQCSARAGIRKQIRVVILGSMQAPASLGVFSPVIIIPEAYAKEAGREQLEYVFLHELMHFRRRDTLVMTCLNALRAVYWFNPVVWLCCRLIQRDMEADCDRMVAETLEAGKLRGYIEAILHFSGIRPRARIQAAMSLNDGCMKMRDRVRRMYMSRRTKPAVKAAVLVLALLMAFAGFTTGCEAAPARAISNDALYENTVAEWKTDNMTQGDVTIHVDAQVYMPETDEYPVYAYERGYITKEQTDKMADYLFDRLTYKDENKLSGDGSHYMNYSVHGDIGRGEDATLQVHNEGAPSYLQGDIAYLLQDVKPYLQFDYNDLSIENGPAEDLKTTPEQAIEIAQEMLDACGFEFDAVFADERVVVESGHENEPAESKPGCYAVHCLKRVKGFYLTELVTNSDTNTNPAVDACVVYLDDQGIFKVELDWYGNPGELIRKDTDVLPIEGIEPMLAREIARQYDRPGDTKVDITIKKAVLGLGTFPSEEPGQWELQPVWTFFGWIKTDEYSFEGREWMLFSLSATDGVNTMYWGE